MPKLVMRSLTQVAWPTRAHIEQALLSEFVDGSGRHFSDAQVG